MWQWRWVLDPFAPPNAWQREWQLSHRGKAESEARLDARWPNFAARWRQWRAAASWTAAAVRDTPPPAGAWKAVLQAPDTPQVLRDPARTSDFLTALPAAVLATPQDCLDLGVMAWQANNQPAVQAAQDCWQAQSASKSADAQPVALALAGEVTALVAQLDDPTRVQIALWPSVRLLLAQRAWAPLQRLLAKLPAQSVGWTVQWPELALAVAVGARDAPGIADALAKLPALEPAALDAAVVTLMELNAPEFALVALTRQKELNVASALAIQSTIARLLLADASGSSADLERRSKAWAEVDAALPAGPAANWARALAAVALRREREVQPLLAQLPASVLDLPEAKVLLAEAAQATGRGDLAIAQASEVLRRWPDRVDALLVRARAHRDGNPQAALADLRQARLLANATMRWHYRRVLIDHMIEEVEAQGDVAGLAKPVSPGDAPAVRQTAVELDVPTGLLAALGLALAASVGMLWAVLAGRRNKT